MTVREAVRASLRLLGKRDRRLFGLAVLVQMAIVFLDLVGVLLLGALGVLAVSIAQGMQPPRVVRRAIDMFGMGSLSNASLTAVVGGVAAALLLAKSLLSPILMARVLNFLSRRETFVSSRLTRELFSRPLVFIHRRSSQETSATLFQGANAAIVTVLGQTAVACVEAALLIVLAIVLLLVNPALALGVIIFFAAVGGGLHRLVGGRASELSAERKRADLASLVSVQEGIGRIAKSPLRIAERCTSTASQPSVGGRPAQLPVVS
jgi:ABC-type multidrug transport system fused ATPase/permease subunit